MVKAEYVRKRFGRLEVLKGMSLEVAPRAVVCMIGPSGSGKSTFLRCVNHLEKIDGGRLSVDGELVGYRQKGDKLYELRESEMARKRAEIGMVFQSFNLFPHMTALGNVIEAPIRVKGLHKREAARAGPRAAPAGRSRGQGRRVPRPPLGRPAAARGDRAGARHAAEADAVRRGHQRTRPRAGQGGARRDARPGSGGDDDDRGHPRDRRSPATSATGSSSWTAA